MLRWLAEAHAYGDVDAYVAAVLQDDRPVPPLDRLAREAAAGARTTMKGKRPELANAAVRSALREMVFRYELVLRINVTAHELLDREARIDAAISANVSLLTYLEPRPATHTGQLGQLRDLIVSRVAELRAVQEARALAEERYLDGPAALFPEVAAAWDAQLATTEAMAAFTVRLAQAEGVPDIGLADAEVISSRTAQFLADLVQPATSGRSPEVGRRREGIRHRQRLTENEVHRRHRAGVIVRHDGTMVLSSGRVRPAPDG